MNILLLDIDGVLNNHSFNPISQSNTILPRCVQQLNRIIYDTNCKIVICSSWRYMILMKAMTIKGFEYMLRTHGIACEDRIIDTTTFDIKDGSERAMQVEQWLNKNKSIVSHYCVLDDGDFPYRERGINFVRPDGKVGLTELEANRVILTLRGMV